MILKPLIIVLTVLFLALQYKLWFEQGGVSEVWQLQKKINTQTLLNNQMADRNSALVAEIHDLKSGQNAIEEHARNDLGMVKPGEVFYQIIDKPKS